MNCKTLIIIIFLLMNGIRVYGINDKFYNYYENGLEYMERGDYNRAIVEFKSAYSLEFEDTKRKRTYGTKFIRYFPHRETGICHYYLEEYDNAKQELELSLSYKNSGRAEEYLNRIEQGITRQKEEAEEELRDIAESEKLLAEQKKRIEEEKKRKEQKRLADKKRLEEEKKALALKKEQEQKALEEKRKRLAEEKNRMEEEDRLRKEQEALALKEKQEEEKKLEEEKKEAEEKRLAEEEKNNEQIEQQNKAMAMKEEIEMLEKQKLEEDKNEAEAKLLEEEKERRETLAMLKEQEALAEKIAELEKRKIELQKHTTKPNVPLTAEPVKVNRVGSPLSVAIIPIMTGSEEDSHIENMIMEKLVTNLVKKRRFKVIEREFLDKIMQEQSLGMTGIIDEESAINAGKVIGAEAIIMGKLNEVQGFYHISTRLIDVETSETITANEITSRIKDIDRSAEKLSTMIVNEMPLFEGTVIKADGEQVFLDVGKDIGVRKGNKFTIYRKGNEIKHPVTGEIMGYNVKPLGEAVAINIQEKMCIAKIVKEGSINIGDKAVIK